MATVTFEHLEKRFPDGTLAVQDFNLDIADGELMVFVGPSGCGKSTLLRLLSGLEQPSGGVLRIGGRPVNGLSPQERNVAMVFQDYALYPHLTVRGNLEFPLKMRRMAAADMARRIDWAAGLLGLEALLERLPRQLSGGQRQRVAMGRALVREPTVFLLDEPLSNLDAKLRGQVRAEIGELQRRTGTTMIYVTHDQVEAMTLGARVAVLHQGRLQQVAAPRELYACPANAFVAGFIGNPPMNLIPARLAGEHGAGTVGIRPEDLSLQPEGAAGPSLRGTLVNLEYLGHETLVHVELDDPEGTPPQMVARLPGRQDLPRTGTLILGYDPAHLHRFDTQGHALPQGPEIQP